MTSKLDESSARPELALQPSPSRSLPPRRGIAGIAGFQASSRVLYAANPDEPHELSTIYLFPDRMRMRLSLDRGKNVERVLLYRFGEQGFCVDERESRSRELTGQELSELRLQSETRRALFLWPDGIDWQGGGDARVALLETVGKLEVELDAEGRPGEMHSTHVDGEEFESLRSIAWKKSGKRYFPARFELYSGGKLICSEEVLEVETKLDYVDEFFLPPDRRISAREPPRTRFETVDAPAIWQLRIPLDTATPASIGSALALAETQREQWRSRAPSLIDETILELDREARPIAILLHAQDAGMPASDAWSRRAECPAWTVSIDHATDVSAAQIAALAERCETEGADLRAELHVSSASSTERALLVMLRR